MNVQPLAVDQNAAVAALKQYREHRAVYDKRDWEIERIYRAISKGKTVIAALDAIRLAGLNQHGLPKLAIMRADQQTCLCQCWSDHVAFTNENRSRASEWHFKIPWDRRPLPYQSGVARLPRIPPQHRPASKDLWNYHILWEADWQDIPRDPYLLKRIGKDAWIVLAAWELTEVELSVLRAHQ